MTSHIPFSIHEYLRAGRHAYDEPQFHIHGNTKKYDRMPQIPLQAPKNITVSLADAMHKRHSSPHDHGADLEDLTVSDLSDLFGLALRARPNGTRPYPSGGGLYPIETYFVGTLEGAPTAHVYHYDPTEHALADLWPLPENVTMKDIFPIAEFAAPACIVFTGMWGRNGTKYGDFGYYLGMLEAGHMAQNILLAATTLDIGTRPMGGFDDAIVSKLLDIDENLEQVVYVLMIGKST